MAAQSAGVKRPTRQTIQQGALLLLPVKATSQIWEGGLVSVIAGYAKAAADAFGEVVMGVALQDQLGGASDGDTFIMVQTAGRFEFTAVTGAAANIGKIAYVTFDGTVQCAATTYNVIAGRVTRYLSSTSLEIELIPAAGLATTPASGGFVIEGNAAFTTTGATKAVSAGGLTTVSSAIVTPNAAIGVDEALYFTTLTISANTLTVGRTGATKTSGLSFSYRIVGV